MKTKYFIKGVFETNKFIEDNKKSKILIISLGNQRTELPSSRENIVEVDVMMEDNNKPYTLFDFKILLIKYLLEQSKCFNYVIIRCDLGASRSQAIGTLFRTHFNIPFIDNDHIGNHSILKAADYVLKRKKLDENDELRKMFINRRLTKSQINILDNTIDHTYLCKCRKIYLQLSSLNECDCHKPKEKHD